MRTKSAVSVHMGIALVASIPLSVLVLGASRLLGMLTALISLSP